MSLGVVSVATAQGTSAASGAYTYILLPHHGEVVSSPVKVVFGLDGIGVAPAGAKIENTGHHRLLIDVDAPDRDLSIPSDARHRHFGKGQTEATIVLAPGKHTLQLLLGDYTHIPHQPAIISARIQITVR